MANTYQLIQTITVPSGGSATIQFSSIPQTYTDLVLLLSGRTTYSAIADDMALYFNGVTTNRTSRFLYGNGASATSTTNPDNHGGTMTADTASVYAWGNAQIYIPNYTSTSVQKHYVSESVAETNGATSYQDMATGIWASTAAITSIEIPTAGGRGVYKQYSVASLYGIKKS